VTYEYLPHTADVKVRAVGKDFSEACIHAARSITGLLTQEIILSHQQYAFRLHAKTKEALLYDFLNEVIYLKDVHEFVPVDANIHIHEENGWLLDGILIGDELSHYEHSGDVKAATFHDLKITEGPAETVLEFVLDI
jgi:SHS2 domain-containing protein